MPGGGLGIIYEPEILQPPPAMKKTLSVYNWFEFLSMPVCSGFFIAVSAEFPLLVNGF